MKTPTFPPPFEDILPAAPYRDRFRLYWALIRLPSGLIRRSWLAAIDRRACP